MKINNPFEKKLKRVVLEHLLKKGIIDNNSIIINELTIDSFSRRADLVVIKNKKMIAYEIKSDADSLNRLPGQLDKYLEYFDKVIVVTTSKHTLNILKSINEKIEVWEIIDDKVIVKKRGKLQRIENKEKYLDLLKVHEMKKMAHLFNIKIDGKNKQEVKKYIVRGLVSVSFEKVKAFTINAISNRYMLTSNLFRENVLLRHKVILSDIDLLSPYSVERTNKAIVHEESILKQLMKL
ncbi:sce7726 family protein [Citrobacter sp. Cpo113]|uniref:sce7726 family protein n=1 Tax=Citrobacter sp. Cpo113 TaxID=2985146 RepID=UPI002574CC57|nr:sce7726 family protein [Citrobacter sp. Cpo113]MDM2787028.1 sce7726 family protein [Citrobacter sp. Cpo113]